MAVVIRQCSCKHEFQDQKYGRGMRVHNQQKHDAKRQGAPYRCSVCRNQIIINNQ